MIVEMFNVWYFFWIFLSIACYVGLYYLLKNKTEKTKKIVLFSILALALFMHFTKVFYPPYSTNKDYYLREVFFVNICGANILFFPFMFFSKNQKTKDYMFFMGLVSGFASVCYPTVALFKSNPLGEWMDIVRYYVHHSILWIVPLLMVTLKLHKPSYKSFLSVSTYLVGVLLFVMINQVLQSEIGIISLRDGDFFDINYPNPSLIWGPNNDWVSSILTYFCPNVFKYVPVGQYAGQIKYWPLFWLLVPIYLLGFILVFSIGLIFDFQTFKTDINNLKTKIKTLITHKD